MYSFCVLYLIGEGDRLWPTLLPIRPTAAWDILRKKLFPSKAGCLADMIDPRRAAPCRVVCALGNFYSNADPPTWFRFRAFSNIDHFVVFHPPAASPSTRLCRPPTQFFL